MNKLDKICRKAIEKWGDQTQVQMLIEEMAELSVELCHFLRKRGDYRKQAEEIADVEIMIHQVKFLLGIGIEVEQWKKIKLDRIEKKLD